MAKDVSKLAAALRPKQREDVIGGLPKKLTGSYTGDSIQKLGKRAQQIKPLDTALTAELHTNSRSKKVQIGTWLNPEFKRSLLMIKVQMPSVTMEQLHEEALNDLFRKYNVPTVSR